MTEEIYRELLKFLEWAKDPDLEYRAIQQFERECKKFPKLVWSRNVMQSMVEKPNEYDSDVIELIKNILEKPPSLYQSEYRWPKRV